MRLIGRVDTKVLESSIEGIKEVIKDDSSICVKIGASTMFSAIAILIVGYSIFSYPLKLLIRN